MGRPGEVFQLDAVELAKRATMYAEEAVAAVALDVVVSVADMERITAAIASAFVVGCGAGVEMVQDAGASGMPRTRGGKRVR